VSSDAGKPVLARRSDQRDLLLPPPGREEEQGTADSGAEPCWVSRGTE